MRSTAGPDRSKTSQQGLATTSGGDRSGGEPDPGQDDHSEARDGGRQTFREFWNRDGTGRPSGRKHVDAEADPEPQGDIDRVRASPAQERFDREPGDDRQVYVDRG